MQRRTFLSWCAVASTINTLRCYGFDIIKDSKLNSKDNGDVYVKWFGTDANAIQKANDLAFTSKATVIFDDIDYIIDKQITISTIWRGTPRKTRIIISDYFFFQKSFDPISYSAITNTHLAKIYNSSTADSIEIHGIDFLHRAKSNSDKETLALANIKSGGLYNCQFSTDTSTIVNPIDLFACVKNFSIENVRAVNSTQAKAGGAIWIRNITDDGSDLQNTTENIVIHNSYFATSTVDEAIAVYGVCGIVKNIKILNTQIVAEKSPIRHGTLASTFPLGKTPYAGVDNVLWDSCKFKTNNFQNHVIRIGSSSDSTHRCNNVKIKNCTFLIDNTSSSISYVARNTPCLGNTIAFEGNHIYADTSHQAITNGVSGFNLATKNTLSGNIKQAFEYCETVSYNTTQSLNGTAVFNCRDVHHNNFSAVSNGIVCNESITCNIHDNKIQLEISNQSSFGIMVNSIAGSHPLATITNNVIVSKNAKSRGLFIHPALTKTILSSNTFSK